MHSGLRASVAQAAILFCTGLLLSLLSLAAGGRVSWSDGPQLLLALEEQRPVFSWSADAVAARLGDGTLVVDGRSPEEHRQSRPDGSLNVPFEDRHSEIFQIPQGRQVDAVLVVLEARRMDSARELARTLARQWGASKVATLRGGWEAWLDAGLPRTDR